MPSIPSLYVAAELPTINGDPLDASHNTFAFQVDAVDSTSIADAMLTVKDFYTHSISSHTISQQLGGQLSRAANAAVLRCYDISAHLDGSPHGSPVGISTFTLDAAVETDPSLPEGVALAGTFHSAYGTDVEFGVGTRPRARDRGRIYLGPLSSDWVDFDTTTHRVKVAASMRTIYAAHLDYMRTNPHGTCVWGVWSRANASLNAVAGGWIDDRFDYQRRREDQSTVRTLWP